MLRNMSGYLLSNSINITSIFAFFLLPCMVSMDQWHTPEDTTPNPRGGERPRNGLGRQPVFVPVGIAPIRVQPGVNPNYGWAPFGLSHHVVDWSKGTIGFHHPKFMIDEEFDDDCRITCGTSEFFCQDSCSCVGLDKRCDGVVDCTETEDEAGCVPVCDERQNKTICPGTGACISKDWLCDGDNDCGDYSDETHCGSANCTGEQFECANGLCIHHNWVCDHENDCKDDSDETNCTITRCAANQFQCKNGQCISLHWKCDKEPDCADHSDEETCTVDLRRCGESQFQCANKRCIRKEFQCDGDNDCKDWSDEDDCPVLPGNCNAGEFKCNDGKCIPNRWRCDREKDCSDGSDEEGCGPEAMRNCTEEEHTCADKRCILMTWLCDGMKDCSTGEDELHCDVHCEEDQYMCRQYNNRTFSSVYRTCVNKKHVCDGQRDCPRGDDEENCPVRRKCGKSDKCDKICITTHDGKPACACPPGWKLGSDGYTCHDIDECMYEQDPVCSQTCSNTEGSFICGCMTGYDLRPDRRSCKANGASAALLFSNRLDIRQVTLSGDRYTSVLKGLHNAVALDYHYKKKLIFWTENSLDVIRMARIDSANATDVVKWGLDSPGGVAIDWIHDLLFWTDSGTRRVEVSTLDGRLRAVIAANDLDKPRAIAVHPGDALVFWTDWGPNPKIEKSEMDGNKRKSIVSENIFWPNGLTIDYVQAKIYWADAKHHIIESANFDGRDRRKVTNKGLPHPFALTMFEDAIYWTDWHTKSISTVNKKTGKGFQHIHTGPNTPMDIKSFHPLRQPTTFRNHCGRNNGGCSHLCLPNSGGYVCQCPVGFNINTDRRTCEDSPEKLLLFGRKKDIRLKQLNPKTHKEAIDMVIPLDNVKSAMALAWDHNSNSIFWTDIEKDTINRAFLNGSHQSVIISTNLISPAGLAFDWLTNKLYWTDAGTNRIEASNADGSIRTLLAWEDIDKPRDIVVDPIGGVMYWSDWGKNPCIESAAMDGTGRKRIIKGNMTWPNGLALDLELGRLYWTDGGTKMIEYADLNGNNRAVLIGHDLTHPFSLDLYGDEVFWTDWDTNSIQAANKRTGENRRTLGGGITGLMDVRVFHKERQGGTNRCGKNNGGCSHMCLLKPGGYSCACPIGIKLSNDGRRCTPGPMNYLIFAHRVDLRVVSLDVPYLIDVVIPLPQLKNALGVDVDTQTGRIYWTDTAEKVIQSANLDGKDIRTVVSNGLHTADGIVVDSVGRKIYWTDGGRNSIEVAELDGKYRKVLIWTGLDSPRAIALFYRKGYMFWSDWGTKAKIERADMDGMNRRVIIDNNIIWPNGLAVDKNDERLYWSDAKLNTIDSSDFNGNKRRTVISNVDYPYGLVIVNRHIYWTDWKTKALHRSLKNNSTEKTIIRGNLEGLMDIRAVHAQHKEENACGTENGGCSHLCLRSSEGYTCACPTGLLFEKSPEPRKTICKTHPDNFLMLATRGGVAMISLDTPEQWDVTLPIDKVQNSYAVDYHWEKNLIFYADVDLDAIRNVDMGITNMSNAVITDKVDLPNGLAVDWIANNIYWTDDHYKVVEVARLDGSCRKVLISRLDDPRSLALFPGKGYLFWSDWSEKSPRIERALLDGSNRQIIVDTDLGFPNGLAVDYEERRLYWTDSMKDRIDTSDLNGNHRVRLLPEAKHPFGLAQFGDHIYWANWVNKSIMKADKKTGQNLSTIRTDLEVIIEVKAVSKEKQQGWNPCKENNGGCSHLCFFVQKSYVCGCPDEPDDRHCYTSPKTWVPLKMPSHYPKSFDYSESDEDKKVIPAVHAETENSGSSFWTYFTFFVLSAVAAGCLTIYVVSRWSRRREQVMKEDFRESSRHISFLNPNYSCNAGSQEPLEPRRANKLHGIFKYDRSQERVINEYTPEGTSLLDQQIIDPLPPRLPRSTSNDDFEPVMLNNC